MVWCVDIRLHFDRNLRTLKTTADGPEAEMADLVPADVNLDCGTVATELPLHNSATGGQWQYPIASVEFVEGRYSWVVISAALI